MKRKPLVLRAVQPNAGLRALYREKLECLIEDMHRSAIYWLTRSYNAHPPELAQDRSPAVMMKRIVAALRRRWLKRFDETAPELARFFAQAAHQRSDRQLQAILKRAGIAVEFKLTKEANDVLQATIAEQVNLIRSIPQQYLTQVEGLVMRSVQQGHDMGALTKGLQHQLGVTKRRAAFIARDQTAKANAVIVRVRQQSLGVKEALWLHSHGGKTPRPSHVANNHKRYDVATGWYDPAAKVWTWPGVLPNCRCVARPIIPGLDDGRYSKASNA